MNARILYIHNEQKVKYGAHYINDTIVQGLRKRGNIVDTIYPKESINLLSKHLSGINNILFFFSLIDKREKVKKYNIIQGTTYTTLPFIGTGVPTIAHFGSTTFGFLKSVPTFNQLKLENEKLGEIFSELKTILGINGFNFSLKSLKDISNIEIHVAKKSSLCIATSEKVKKELIQNKVPKSKIIVIHNAIEDYWFSKKTNREVKDVAEIVYLGRMGDDVFTIKLKGINRLIFVLQRFKKIKKNIIGMCHNVKKYEEFFSKIPNTTTKLSMEKKKIPKELSQHYGDIYVNPGRYEGFCLSLVEAMSQGLIPVIFPIGVVEEIISNGKNGFIVKDLSEMVERINFLKKSKKLRQKMAQEAVKTAQQFKPKIMIQKLITAYQQIPSKITNKNEC